MFIAVFAVCRYQCGATGMGTRFTWFVRHFDLGAPLYFTLTFYENDFRAVRIPTLGDGIKRNMLADDRAWNLFSKYLEEVPE